jgi:4-aminobutyrate aminotransferase-like enzyme
VSCRAALATLCFHQRHDLGRRSTVLGTHLQDRLGDLAERHPAIAEVRGRGLMVGVELRDHRGEPAAALTDRILEEMKDAGYLLGRTGPGRNVITFPPPLVIEAAALDGAVTQLDEMLTRHG